MGASAAALMVVCEIRATIRPRGLPVLVQGQAGIKTAKQEKWQGGRLQDGLPVGPWAGPDFNTFHTKRTKTATMLRHVLSAGGRGAVSAARPQRYVLAAVGDNTAALIDRLGERNTAETGVSPEASLKK